MADTKVSKTAAQYSHGMDGRYCGACRHFLPPNACEIVEGEIGADMWCRFFAPRTVRQDIRQAMTRG